MTTTDTPRTDACLNTHSMINHQKWCHKCGGFVEGIYAGNPMSCRCDPKADRIKELEAEVERLKTLMHQTIWFVDDMIKTHTNGCEHCLKKHGAMIALFKDITEGPQWPIDPTDK